MTNELQKMSVAALLDAFEHHEKPEVIIDELIRRRKEAGFESLREYLFVREFDTGENLQGLC